MNMNTKTRPSRQSGRKAACSSLGSSGEPAARQLDLRFASLFLLRPVDPKFQWRDLPTYLSSCVRESEVRARPGTVRTETATLYGGSLAGFRGFSRTHEKPREAARGAMRTGEAREPAKDVETRYPAAADFGFLPARSYLVLGHPFQGLGDPYPQAAWFSKTLQTFAANHGQTYRGRALLVENFQRAETAKPVPPV
ncbi:hypothetical protein THAOC_22957 [Thalassiosira oceanica]|uniref:Uncharacterized protein n=1 Tax=Thalassiosira oceanica TaxID=159749 RepID=K0RVN1_THAOC|nr:hypothetical protein THAOC_22957 [Thalassiosira oceanica]|eukprot:EJK57045.1 hypothetical protein THAOC_22957 [Thalassiosira oceanica]